MGICCRWAFPTRLAESRLRRGMTVLSGTEATLRFRSARSSRGLETSFYNRTPNWNHFLAQHHRKITYRSWKELKHIYVVFLGKNTRVEQNFYSRLKSRISLSGVQENQLHVRGWALETCLKHKTKKLSRIKLTQRKIISRLCNIMLTIPWLWWNPGKPHFVGRKLGL